MWHNFANCLSHFCCLLADVDILCTGEVGAGEDAPDARGLAAEASEIFVVLKHFLLAVLFQRRAPWVNKTMPLERQMWTKHR